MKSEIHRASSRGFLREAADVAALVTATLGRAVRASTWRQPVRDVLARQLLFTGVEALRFTCLVAVLVGLSVVVQAQVWLSKAGQTDWLGPLLAAAVLREAAPLLINLIVVARSGAAIATELGHMRLSGETHALDAMGIDPLIYLAVPRILGVALSVFCLTVLFSAVALAGGWAAGALLGATTRPPDAFFDDVLRAIRPADAANLVLKTLGIGLTVGALCVREGLRVRHAVTEIPQAASRAVVRAIGAVFVLSALFSLAVYQ